MITNQKAIHFIIHYLEKMERFEDKNTVIIGAMYFFNGLLCYEEDLELREFIDIPPYDLTKEELTEKLNKLKLFFISRLEKQIEADILDISYDLTEFKPVGKPN